MPPAQCQLYGALRQRRHFQGGGHHGELQASIPAVAQEWTKNNQVYLGGVGLDTYGILTNFPVKTVDDIDGHKIAAPGLGQLDQRYRGRGRGANLNEYYNGIQDRGIRGDPDFS